MTFKTSCKTNKGVFSLRLSAFVNNENVGFIDYSINKTPRIEMIFVKSTERRKGYATEMFNELQKEHGEIEWTDMTPDGKKFYNKIKETNELKEYYLNSKKIDNSPNCHNI